MNSLPVELVCPRCRMADPARVSFLIPADTGSAGWGETRCPGCGSNYPIVEGIPCVPPHLDSFRQAQADAMDPAWNGILANREDALQACAACGALEPGSYAFREAFLSGLYAAAHFPEGLEIGSLRSELACNLELISIVRKWLAVHAPQVAGSAGCALDAGCGPGRLVHVLAAFQPNGCIGLDLRLGMLRMARRLADWREGIIPFRMEGTRFQPLRISNPCRSREAPVHWVQGDILLPPFQAEVFPLVSAVSLLDTVNDPLFALGQLDALVCAGGLLLLAAPYHWEPEATPPDAWLSGPGRSAAEIIRLALAGGHPGLPHLDYEVLEETPFLPYALPSHARLVHRYFLDVILARKHGGD